MTKTDAITLFGGRKEICEALFITRQTLYNFPDELPQARADQIHGAYLRLSEERDKKVIHLFGNSKTA